MQITIDIIPTYYIHIIYIYIFSIIYNVSIYRYLFSAMRLRSASLKGGRSQRGWSIRKLQATPLPRRHGKIHNLTKIGSLAIHINFYDFHWFLLIFGLGRIYWFLCVLVYVFSFSRPIMICFYQSLYTHARQDTNKIWDTHWSSHNFCNDSPSTGDRCQLPSCKVCRFNRVTLWWRPLPWPMAATTYHIFHTFPIQPYTLFNWCQAPGSVSVLLQFTARIIFSFNPGIKTGTKNIKTSQRSKGGCEEVPPWTKRCRPQRATPKRKRGAGRSSAGPICHLGRGAWHSDRPWLWPCLATSCYMEFS